MSVSGICRFLMIAAVVLGAASARAEVVGLEITERSAFAGGAEFGATGAYEKITGRLRYAVDPDHSANRAVVDLDLAPTNDDGKTEFAAEFVLLRPVDAARGNGTLLYEVGNRGNLGMLSFFNSAPRTNRPTALGDAGDGFLLRRGYTLLWSAWNWDVAPGAGRLQIALPVATDGGAPITGRVAAEITVNFPSPCEPVAWGNSRGYPVQDPATATLSVRDMQTAPRQEVPRHLWRVGCDPAMGEADRTHLHLDGGFEPGRLYELVYTARDPRIVGLGLVAIRDALSYFRFETEYAIDTSLIFGISQSGRVIQHMLYQGFHLDEAGRGVFDGALIHVAGGGKGSFNHRFAQTTRHGSAHEDHQYPADFFPFTTVPETDPVTGAEGDVLARARAAGHVPKLFYTGTSTEYWTRAASLLHTDPGGSIDARVDRRARIYMIAGAQHGMWSFPHRAIFENCVNPLDHRPIVRALLARLDQWARGEGAPPDSVYPRLIDNELGSVGAWRASFPPIPGLRLPIQNYAPPRLDFGPRWAAGGIIDRVPPDFGPPFLTRVPQPDADGIDRGGIRLPAVAVPLGTYLGWNLRNPAYGAGDQIGRWSGSFVPFAKDDGAAPGANGDPRPSLAARYGSRSAYLGQVARAARALVAQGLMLAEDLSSVTARAGAFYDRLIARDADSESCAYTVSD
ncbi:MAG: alpha/beta hydrolase domain-containing protein [Alphaproteobacteria bacterium]|nr:alpha/beta hydrolase domain-containing protein [Alphaproteobacteria bacterium]MDP6518237.1 alpha/beta hydrolase domain-containing protein [Alphaproteobacteria bacterium]